MENEIWKDIVNYIGLYMVSNYGKIKSLANNHGNNGNYKERILKPSKTDECGHLKVTLCKNGIYKNCKIHKLVLEAFVGPCPLGKEGCHNDGNPGNNFLENLRYDTRKGNFKDKIKHGTLLCGSKLSYAKLNEFQVRIIKRLLKDGYLTQREMAKIFNVHFSTISAIKTGISWNHID